MAHSKAFCHMNFDAQDFVISTTGTLKNDSEVFIIYDRKVVNIPN